MNKQKVVVKLSVVSQILHLLTQTGQLTALPWYYVLCILKMHDLLLAQPEHTFVLLFKIQESLLVLTNNCLYFFQFSEQFAYKNIQLHVVRSLSKNWFVKMFHKLVRLVISLGGAAKFETGLSDCLDTFFWSLDKLLDLAHQVHPPDPLLVVAHALVQILCIDAVDKLREHLNLFLHYELFHTSYKGLVYSLNRVSATLFVTHTLLQHETDE